MTNDLVGELPPELRRIVAAGREIPPVPAAQRERVYRRLTLTLGFGGPGNGGGPGGGPAAGAVPGKSLATGSSLGAIIAVLLGSAVVSYLVVSQLQQKPQPLNGGGAVIPPPIATAPGQPAGATPPTGARVAPPRFVVAPTEPQLGGPIPDGGGAEAAIDWYGQPGLAPRRVAGLVLDGGRPAPGAEVVLVASLTPPDPRFERRVVTGADGRFDLGKWPAASYTVFATSPGRRPAMLVVKAELAGSMRPWHDLLLVLGDCSFGIEGYVRDESGRGIPDARVKEMSGTGLQGPAVSTDAEGRYRLCATDPADDGRLFIRFEAEAYATHYREPVARPWGRLDVRLVPEAVIQGLAVGADGRAVANAVVWARACAKGIDGGTHNFRTLGDGQGRFELRGLPTGACRVHASSRDLQSEPVAVPVKAGEVSRGIVLSLQPAAKGSAR